MTMTLTLPTRSRKAPVRSPRPPRRRPDQRLGLTIHAFPAYGPCEELGGDPLLRALAQTPNVAALAQLAACVQAAIRFGVERRLWLTTGKVSWCWLHAGGAVRTVALLWADLASRAGEIVTFGFSEAPGFDGSEPVWRHEVPAAADEGAAA